LNIQPGVYINTFRIL